MEKVAEHQNLLIEAHRTHCCCEAWFHILVFVLFFHYCLPNNSLVNCDSKCKALTGLKVESLFNLVIFIYS